MDTTEISSIAGIMMRLDKVTLGMLLSAAVIVILWISFLFVVYLKNKEIGRLVQAVNANTNAVNILLELTKLTLPKMEKSGHDTHVESLPKTEDIPKSITKSSSG